MGSEGRGAAERSAERRETTAHLGSAREPERAAASSSLLPSLPPFLQLGACLARIAALSLQQRELSSSVSISCSL